MHLFTTYPTFDTAAGQLGTDLVLRLCHPMSHSHALHWVSPLRPSWFFLPHGENMSKRRGGMSAGTPAAFVIVASKCDVCKRGGGGGEPTPKSKAMYGGHAGFERYSSLKTTPCTMLLRLPIKTLRRNYSRNIQITTQLPLKLGVRQCGWNIARRSTKLGG